MHVSHSFAVMLRRRAHAPLLVGGWNLPFFRFRSGGDDGEPKWGEPKWGGKSSQRTDRWLNNSSLGWCVEVSWMYSGLMGVGEVPGVLVWVHNFCGWHFLWNFWWTPSHKYWLAYVTICLSFLPRLREGHLSIELLVWFVSQSSRGTQIIPSQLHLLKVGTSSFGKKRKHMTYDSCFSFFTGGFVICVLLTKSLRFAWTWWWIPLRGDFCWEGTICLSFLICLTLN